MLEKVKVFIDKHKKGVLSFLLLNRLFIAFVFFTLLMSIILRMITLGPSTWSFKPIFFDLSIIVLFGSLGYAFKPERQYYYFTFVMCLVTFVCIVNGIYFTFYNSFVKNAVFDKLKLYHFVFLLFPFFYIFVNRNLKKHNYFNYVKKIENGKKNFSTLMLIGIILLCMNIVTLTRTDISRLVKQWNREYIVERYGIVIYQLNDVIQSIKSSFSSYFGYDEAATSFKDFYNNREYKHSNNRSCR